GTPAGHREGPGSLGRSARGTLGRAGGRSALVLGGAVLAGGEPAGIRCCSVPAPAAAARQRRPGRRLGAGGALVPGRAGRRVGSGAPSGGLGAGSRLDGARRSGSVRATGPGAGLWWSTRVGRRRIA